MLQGKKGKKFMKVLTAVTVCTIFTAGFTTQAAANLPEAVTIDTIDKGEKNIFLSEKMGAAPAMETKETKQAAKDAKEAYIAQQRKLKEDKKRKEEADRLAAEEAQRAEQIKQAAEKAAQEAAQQAEQEEARQAEARQAAAQPAAQSVSAGDQELLASIIFCEAGNQPYEGQVAVGAVIMNRVRSGVYPNSISDVIYQSGQFGPAMTGWLDSVLLSGGYTDTAMSAAADAIAGTNPIGDCLYFGNGDYGIQIGDHFFH